MHDSSLDDELMSGGSGIKMGNQVENNRNMNTSYRNYREDDSFTFCGKEVFSVLDFWRYRYGYLAGQSPEIAEFLVARALGIEKAENVAYWTAYDMSYRGMRIEVKSTEYVHSWNKKRVSDVRTFSIAPSNNKYWGNEKAGKLSRQNDLYVFCLNTNKEVQNPRPLNLDDWEFFIVETARINRYAEKNGNPNQKKISLNVVSRMAKHAVKWMDLKQEIDRIIDCASRSADDLLPESAHL